MNAWQRRMFIWQKTTSHIARDQLGTWEDDHQVVDRNLIVLIDSWSAVDRAWSCLIVLLIGTWSLLGCQHNELFISDQTWNTLSRTYSFRKSKRSTILFFLFSIKWYHFLWIDHLFDRDQWHQKHSTIINLIFQQKQQIWHKIFDCANDCSSFPS